MYSYKIFDKVNNECENLWKKFEENSKLTFFRIILSFQKYIKQKKMKLE